REIKWLYSLPNNNVLLSTTPSSPRDPRPLAVLHSGSPWPRSSWERFRRPGQSPSPTQISRLSPF
ncbi:hypothetical protein BHM03_00036566, partial [Ensete ventricosum]